MIKEPQALKEIHDIRLQMYEEFKELTPDERMKKINEGAAIERKRIFPNDSESD